MIYSTDSISQSTKDFRVFQTSVVVEKEDRDDLCRLMSFQSGPDQILNSDHSKGRHYIEAGGVLEAWTLQSLNAFEPPNSRTHVIDAKKPAEDYKHWRSDVSKSLIEKISIFGPPCCATILNIKPGCKYQFHKDTPAKSMVRLHLALRTNLDSFIDCEDSRYHIPADGSIWCLNIAKSHRAVNLDAVEDRSHLTWLVPISCFPKIFQLRRNLGGDYA